MRAVRCATRLLDVASSGPAASIAAARSVIASNLDETPRDPAPGRRGVFGGGPTSGDVGRSGVERARVERAGLASLSTSAPNPERAWLGPSLRLSAEVRRVFGAALLGAPSPAADLAGALEYSAEAFAQSASLELRRALRRFRAQPWSPGIMLFRGMPLDPALPPTPDGGAPSLKKLTFVSEALLLGAAQALGEPVGYQGLKAGALIHDVCPVAGAELTESNEGSRAEFGLHTEVAFSPWRPDMLILLCLRQDREKAAQTLFANGAAAVGALPADELALLGERAYVTRAPASFKALHAAAVHGPRHAVLSGPLEAPELTANMQTTRGLTDRHEAALEALKSALARCVREVRLAPGDLIAVDNRTWTHGRRPFTARFDGQDRWLQRIYVRANPFVTRGASVPDAPRLLHPLPPEIGARAP